MPETDLEEWVYSLKKCLHILYKKSLDGPRYQRECVRGHRDATGTELYRKAECIITEKDTFFYKHVHWLIAHVIWWVAQRWPQQNVISLSLCLDLVRAAPWSFLPRTFQKLWLFPFICPHAVYEPCLQVPYSITCATHCPAQCLASAGKCYISEGTKLWMTNRMQCSFEFILQIRFCFISLNTFIYWPSTEITLVSH